MTGEGAAVVQQVRLADPVEAFTALCQARAMLFARGELELHEAVDALQAAAVRAGLVEQLGQDEVQRLMAEAFGRVRDQQHVELIERPASKPADEYKGLSSTFARACKLADRQHAQEQERINKRAEEFHADIPLIARDGVPSAEALQRAYERRIARRNAQYGIPRSVEQTAEWLRFQTDDPKRLEAWLLEHNERDRRAIIAHLKKKGAPKP
jgi:hypothetical protein